jgi:hypothetical protein
MIGDWREMICKALWPDKCRVEKEIRGGVEEVDG